MNRSTRLRQFQKLLAPGTPLREGLDRIVSGRTGALVVLGSNARVAKYSSGGFRLDVEYSPQALRELAKMDGAIILNNAFTQIVAAGVQLTPPSDLPTPETGTRHRAADRMAQAAGVPTITVSASMSIISLFMEGHRQQVEVAERVVSRANQTLATLTRFTNRLMDVLDHFNILEVAQEVTIRDLAQLSHHVEMTRRLSAETLFHIDLLGAESRHVELQHAEVMTPFDGLAELLTDDFSQNLADPSEFRLDLLQNFSTEELLNHSLVAERLGFGPRTSLETALHSRGIRLLTQVGRLPSGLVTRLVDQQPLHELFGTTIASLTEIEGIGPRRARMIRDALLRISEAATRPS